MANYPVYPLIWLGRLEIHMVLLKNKLQEGKQTEQIPGRLLHRAGRRLLERGIFYKLKSVGGIRQEAFIIELEGVY